jgi:hypothetical protein
MYTCRECEREINPATEVCPHCGTDLSAEAQPSELPEKKPRLAKVVLRYAILLAAIWGFLWYVLPERRGGEAAAAAESKAIEALGAARGALAAYAGAREGTYPASLDALPGESFAEVRAAAQAAQREGYRLEYSLSGEEKGAPARNFVLIARPGHYSYRNFYMDESGIIRATRESRPASAQDPPI